MTKLFTIKDFIRYNAPCFNCNNKISITFSSAPGNKEMGKVQLHDIISFRPEVKYNKVHLDLAITYTATTNLTIDLKTNKYSSNNMKGLQKYLKNNSMFINSNCSHCHTAVISDILHFDHHYIKAVSLWWERLNISDRNKNYQIDTWFNDDSSVLLLNSSNVIQMPLTPKYKFASKKELLEKCQIYSTFQ